MYFQIQRKYSGKIHLIQLLNTYVTPPKCLPKAWPLRKITVLPHLRSHSFRTLPHIARKFSPFSKRFFMHFQAIPSTLQGLCFSKAVCYVFDGCHHLQSIFSPSRPSKPHYNLVLLDRFPKSPVTLALLLWVFLDGCVWLFCFVFKLGLVCVFCLFVFGT